MHEDNEDTRKRAHQDTHKSRRAHEQIKAGTRRQAYSVQGQSTSQGRHTTSSAAPTEQRAGDNSTPCTTVTHIQRSMQYNDGLTVVQYRLNGGPIGVQCRANDGPPAVQK